MILYRLNVYPDDADGEGEDHDEWYSALRDAKRARARHIAADPCLSLGRYGGDYAIDRVEIADMPRKKLALAILNRRGYVVRIDRVVDMYRGDHDFDDDGRCKVCGEDSHGHGII